MTEPALCNYRLDWQARSLLCLANLLSMALLVATLPGEGMVRGLMGLLALGFAATAVGWGWQYRARRLPQLAAWLPLAGFPICVIMLLTDPSWQAVAAVLAMPAMFMLAGLGSYLRQPAFDGIPWPVARMSLALKIALDEAMLGYFVSTVRSPSAQRVTEIAGEVHTVLDLFQANGWDRNPAGYHQPPDVPEDFSLQVEGFKGRRFEVLEFPSPYAPHLDLPGGEEWVRQCRTSKVHARLFEHEGEPRPWLMCIHGYRMGWPYLDFQLFSPAWLHQRLGFNLIMPLLPLHGPRKEGFRSGDGFFEGDLVQLLHAESQAVADLRACLYWLRAHRTVHRLGVYGVSLGGLNTSLLACLESDIDSLVAGIPLVDPAVVFALNAKPRLVRQLQAAGVDQATVAALLRPVSPLSMPCRVKPDARVIIAGSQDRILPLEPIQALQAHWDGCKTHWFAGSHLSIRREPEVSVWLKAAWRDAGLLETAEADGKPEELQPTNAGRQAGG